MAAFWSRNKHRKSDCPGYTFNFFLNPHSGSDEVWFVPLSHCETPSDLHTRISLEHMASVRLYAGGVLTRGMMSYSILWTPEIEILDRTVRCFATDQLSPPLDIDRFEHVPVFLRNEIQLAESLSGLLHEYGYPFIR
jgi:hypothetical protein